MAGYPASRGHEYQDAIIYAQWGVDYLNNDWCNTDGLSAVGAYTTMRDALHAAGTTGCIQLCVNGEITSHGNGEGQSVISGVHRRYFGLLRL